jgi:hypothetical protein
MKFLIQRTNGEIRHDFAFTLLENLRFRKWLNRREKKNEYIVKFVDYDDEIPEPDDIYPMPFKPFHKDYVPVGSVEFVTDFLNHFYGIIPKPVNVPPELALRGFTQRPLINGDERIAENLNGMWFVKSADKIKGYKEVLELDVNHYTTALPKGNYQYSQYRAIDSEWRAFVYDKKLVGLQCYSGEFTVFPNVDRIKLMIAAYSSAPIAYTLDVGVYEEYDQTFVIEVHDFFSCGLYGFNSIKYSTMLHRWFKEYLHNCNLLTT